MGSNEDEVSSSPPAITAPADSPLEEVPPYVLDLSGPKPRLPSYRIHKHHFRTADSIDAAEDINVRDDLADFGLDAKSVRRIASLKRGTWDGTEQRPNGYKAKKEEATAAREKRERTKKGGNGYEHLRLSEKRRSNWVLYDPNQIYPEAEGQPCSELPPHFEQYKTYEVGNERILEYNTASHNVRLKSTPQALQGKSIEYRDRGPVIIERKRKRRPSKEVKVVRARIEARRVILTSSDMEDDTESESDVEQRIVGVRGEK